MGRMKTVGLVLVALALVAGACGDDDDLGAITSGTAGSSGGDQGTSGDLPDFSGDLSSEDCVAAAMAMATAFSGGLGITSDADSVQEAFGQMAAAAPSEIAADMGVIADALGEFYGILEDAGIDLSDATALSDPAVGAVLQQASAALESTDFEEATENVDAWFESQCAE